MSPVLLALIVIAILLVVIIAGQPDVFAVTRSAQFSAPPEKIFPHVNDLHLWNEWSPWAKLDPNAKIAFDGPASGTGTSMKWEGNHKIGVGKMTITESRPNCVIRLRLDFEKPMQATNTAEFDFIPEGNGTVVRWSMAGKNSPMGRIMGLFMNCEKMIGCQYDKGLANLKAVVERTS